MKMMQKSLLALAVLATTAMNVQAASNMEVKVTGSIDPGTCTPTLNGGGTIDYGTMSPSTLNATGFTQLDVKTIDFTIACTAPSKVALVPYNGRPNTTAGTTGDMNGGGAKVVLPAPGLGGYNTAYAAGLGLAGTARVGGYEIALMDNSVLDTVKADNLQRYGVGAWGKTDTVMYYEGGNGLTSSTWASSNSTTPLAFTNMSGTIAVKAFINERSALDLKNVVKLDGLTTLELVYLP